MAIPLIALTQRLLETAFHREPTLNKTLIALALAVVSATSFAADYFVVVPVPNRTGTAKVALNAYTLPSALAGSAYAGFDFKTVLKVTNDPNYSASYAKWALTSGALPQGMTLNASTGMLTGTPVAAGSYSFEVQATYKTVTATQTYPLSVVLVVGELAANTDAAFGDVLVGSSASKTFTFYNRSSVAMPSVAASVQGTGLALTGTNTCGTQAAPRTLAANSNCAYTVTWTPSATGTLSDASTTVTSAASNSPSSLALSGNAKPADADPYWDKVVAMLHGDGADGATSFVDSKGIATWSINGAGTVTTPSISTAVSKFGGAAIYLPATSKNLKSNTALSLGTGDFTIEFWAYKNAELGRPQNLLFSNGGFSIGGNQPGFYTSGWKFSPQEYCVTSGQNCGSYGRMMQAGSTYSVLYTWQHFALTRSGGTFRMYINGTLVGTNTSAYTMDYNPADLFPQLGSSTWQGYVDELRITKGVARYVGSSFALQTQAHPDY